MTTTRTQPKPTSTALLSGKQLSLFWRLFARAWAAHAYRADQPVKDSVLKEEWRHKILRDFGEVESIKQLDQAGFEDVMLELATELDDAREIGYWTSCVERRYRHLVKELLKELSRIDGGRVYDWAYVRATYTQSKHLPVSISEAPSDTLRKVYQMLDTFRRRLERRRLDALEEAPF